MDDAELRRRFAASPVARLATVRPDGAPHVVPVVFALVGDVLYTAVDHKPKRTQRLQRLANLRAEPRCSLLVDHYEQDWSALWWVRADGVARILDRPAHDHQGLAALAQRHPVYRSLPPAGPLVVVTVARWTGWSGSSRHGVRNAARTRHGGYFARAMRRTQGDTMQPEPPIFILSEDNTVLDVRVDVADAEEHVGGEEHLTQGGPGPNLLYFDGLARPLDVRASDGGVELSVSVPTSDPWQVRARALEAIRRRKAKVEEQRETFTVGGRKITKAAAQAEIRPLEAATLDMSFVQFTQTLLKAFAPEVKEHSGSFLHNLFHW